MISLGGINGLLARACLVLSFFPFPPAANAQEAMLGAGADAYLRQNTVALRSISPTDEDYSDLLPLARAIGSARVVQLGESSHGAGEQFEAKARLIRFLHERLGFDALVWESGLFDCRVANGALHSGMDPTAAASMGVFTIWSAIREVRPLLEYIRATVNTSRPLEIAGFDMQFSSFGGPTRLRNALNVFGRVVPDEPLRERIISLADRAMQSYDALASRSRQPHKQRYAYAFVNLRPLRGSAADTVLREMSIRLRGSMSEILPHWPAVMDGVLFIDTARPATRWMAQPSAGPPLHD